MSFCELLKDLRTERGATQKEVADACGITPTCICQLELGVRNPTGSTIRELAKFFDVSADYLLGLEDDFGVRTAAPLPSAPASDPEDQKLLDVYHMLDDDMKATLWSLLNTWTPTTTLLGNKKPHSK